MTDDSLFEDLCVLYKSGDISALARAILYTSMFRCPLPDWAAEAFKAGFERIERGGAVSWDDVFGWPHPKGKHTRSVEQETLKYEVWRTVRWLHQREKRPIDNGLFEDVGTMMGVGGKTTTSKLYYEADRALDRVNLQVEVNGPFNAPDAGFVLRWAEAHADDLRSKGDLAGYEAAIREIKEVRKALRQPEAKLPRK